MSKGSEWLKQAFVVVNSVYRPKEPSERPSGGAISVEVDWKIDNAETRAAEEELENVLYDYFTVPKEGVTEDHVREAWRKYYRLHLRSWSGVTPIIEQKELIQR